MKRTIIIIFVIITSINVFGQRKGDIGVFSGLAYYLGDINPTMQMREKLPAYGIFYRHIFDLRYSIKSSVTYAQIESFDRLSKYDYHIQRNHSFHLEFVDVSSMVEFNFLPYVSTSMKYRHAPYVTAGLTYMFSLNNDVANTMAIPFGIGYKVNITERLSLGAEWTWRKTFTDYLDGLGEYETNPLKEEFLTDKKAEKYRQNSLFNRNDLYTFVGLFISYKIAYKRYKCPAYGELDLVE